MDTIFKDRIVLVTGASRGIGYQLALQYAAAGAHVIAVARTTGGLEELDDAINEAGGSATLVPLDLNDMDAIDQLGSAIGERWGKLDIMVANAGMLGSISPISHVDPKVFDKVMQLNVTSTWRLICATEPLLMKSDAGRAIILSSSSPHSCRAFWSNYAASKAAVEALARCWAAETLNTKLRINCVNPGATRTGMRAQAMPGEDPKSLPHPKEVAAEILPLGAPDLEQTGMYFDVPTREFLSFQRPA